MLIMLAGICILWFGGEAFGRRLSIMLSTGLRFDHHIVNDQNLILGQIIIMLKNALIAMLPLLTGVVIIALVAPVMLGGLVFSTKSLAFQFSKLNPLSGIKRLFSAQVGAELVKALMKALFMGGVAGVFLWHHWPDMMRLMSESPFKAMASALNLTGLCALLVALSIIPMVGFDVFWQIYSHLDKTAHVPSGHPR